METAEGFHFVDPSGRALNLNLRVLRPLKGAHDVEKPAFEVHDGERSWLLKVRPYGDLRTRLRVSFGRSRMLKEIANNKLACAAGFRVAKIAGYGRRRRGLLVAADALLIHWIDDCRSLRQCIEEARAQEQSSAVAALGAMAMDLLIQARRTGLADKDFGLHNILVQRGSPAPEQAVWGDLERVFQAAPGDGFGTGSTLGSFLASWWLVPGTTASQIRSLFDEAVERLPPSDQGWDAIKPLVNQTIAGKLTPHLRFRFIELLPPPL